MPGTESKDKTGVACMRCGGTGIMIVHPHQQTGPLCFRCHGSGIDPNPRSVKAKEVREAKLLASLPDRTCDQCGAKVKRLNFMWDKRSICAKCLNAVLLAGAVEVELGWERNNLRLELPFGHHSSTYVNRTAYSAQEREILRQALETWRLEHRPDQQGFTDEESFLTWLRKYSIVGLF